MMTLTHQYNKHFLIQMCLYFCKSIIALRNYSLACHNILILSLLYRLLRLVSRILDIRCTFLLI